MGHSLRDVLKWLDANPDLQLAGDLDGLLEPTPACPQRSERTLQQQVIDACDLLAAQYPHYAYLFAVPNGQYRRGQRPEPGIRPGVPDLLWPLPRGGYHGLAIELKVGRNQPTPDQRRWLQTLSDLGWHCVVIWDDPGAVLAYLNWYDSLRTEGDAHEQYPTPTDQIVRQWPQKAAA